MDKSQGIWSRVERESTHSTAKVLSKVLSRKIINFTKSGLE